MNAGDDRIVWLGMSGTPGQEMVQFSGQLWDDGPCTVLWTQVDNGAAAVSISPNNSLDAVVVLAARGIYEFRLTADDGVYQASDTVAVTVGTNPCDASHLSTGEPYHAGDFNLDCRVDIADVMYFAERWLVCTDHLTHCGRD